jgi:cardiolipin synthase
MTTLLPGKLQTAIEELIQQAPVSWLKTVCAELRSWPPQSTCAEMISRLPETHNGDLAFQILGILRQSEGLLSWEALGWSIEFSASAYLNWRQAGQVELLWAGPSPGCIPARRIDQALYDLVASAERNILLVTFAAHKIHRLVDSLTSATHRGVAIRLILEFEEESHRQLSMDALKAFPVNLQKRIEIYYWPAEKRETNTAGRPGKLHAKVAIVDNVALITSANLTDDAFKRNLELGALFSGGDVPKRLRSHFDNLIAEGTLALW